MKNQKKLQKISDAFYLINSICCDFHNDQMDRSDPSIEIAYQQLQTCLTILKSVPYLIGKNNSKQFLSENGICYSQFDMINIEREESV
jgi:hypothetical protein